MLTLSLFQFQEIINCNGYFSIWIENGVTGKDELPKRHDRQSVCDLIRYTFDRKALVIPNARMESRH